MHTAPGRRQELTLKLAPRHDCARECQLARVRRRRIKETLCNNCHYTSPSSAVSGGARLCLFVIGGGLLARQAGSQQAPRLAGNSVARARQSERAKALRAHVEFACVRASVPAREARAHSDPILLRAQLAPLKPLSLTLSPSCWNNSISLSWRANALSDRASWRGKRQFCLVHFVFLFHSSAKLPLGQESVFC